MCHKRKWEKYETAMREKKYEAINDAEQKHRRKR